MTKRILTGLIAGLALSAAAVAVADDASMHDVYQEAESGHLDQAQQMMVQVLKDHPDSAKAHYVEAQLDARQRNYSAARSELGTAERLQPGLPFAKPESVRELQNEISAPGAVASAPPPYAARPVSQQAGVDAAPFPWKLVLGLLLIVAVIWMIVRSRQNAARPVVYSNGGPAGYGPGYGGGYSGPVGPNVGGGMGSGIVGGLASGAAMGAGLVAGEELAHHFLDGGERRPEQTAYADDEPRRDVDPNASMGGSDFGIADNSSWDDSSSSADIGGGGDDWS